MPLFCKLKEFYTILDGFPLIVGAGLTADTITEKFQYGDVAIVGSWFRDGHSDYGDMCKEYVRELINCAR